MTGTIVSAGGVTFDLNFDAAALAAPASFRAGVEQAATLLSQALHDKITVNINVDYSGTGGGADGGFDAGQFVSYSTLRDDLIANASPGDTTFNSLPAGASIQGNSQVVVPNAELKALGLMNANDMTTDDGQVNFDTDIASGSLVGVALHELTHAMGRVDYGPQPDIFDLFRFTSAGVRLFSGAMPSASAYFSIDNGQTKLADFGVSSDPADFLNTGVQGGKDAFNEFYSSSTMQSLSSVDLKLLDALGFHTGAVASPSLTVALQSDTGSSSTDGLTRNAALTGGGAANATVTLTDNGVAIGSTVANATGAWTFAPSLADGAHTIVASESGAQNGSASLNFTLATKGPTVSAAQSVSFQSGAVSDTLSINAAAEAVASDSIAGVEVYDGATDLGAATLKNGAWAFTAASLSAGVHSLAYVATDAAGNTTRGAALQVASLANASASLSGGGVAAVFTGAGGTATFSNSGAVWDTVAGSGGSINLSNAYAMVSGGGNQILFAGGNDAVNLSSAAGGWNTVSGSNGTVFLTSTQASVVGGGDSIGFLGANDTVSLLNSGGQWDTVTGSNGQIYLTNAYVIANGGGDFVDFAVGADAAFLTNTGSAWDTVAGVGRTVYLANAWATVIGGNFVVSLSGGNDAASLFNTSGAWDLMAGSNGTAYLNNAWATVSGGGDTVVFASGQNAANLENTGSNWDTAFASNGTVFLTNAGATIIGGGDTIDYVTAGDTASLFNTGASADSVMGVSGALYMHNASANLLATGETIGMNGGGDTLTLQAAFGIDTLSGFDATDTLQFAKADFSSWSALQGHIQQSGANTVIALDANDSITFANTQAASLTASQFHFV